jgi:hypothetical protein
MWKLSQPAVTRILVVFSRGLSLDPRIQGAADVNDSGS